MRKLLNRKRRLCPAVAESLETRLLLAANFSFHSPVNYPLPNGVNPDGVVAVDLRGDGRTDIVTVDNFGLISVLLGNADGTFALAKNYPDGLPNQSPEFGDITVANLIHGDSTPDLIVSYGGSNISILIGNGDGTFKTPEILTVSGNVTSTASAVFTSDGFADIVTANDNGSFSFIRGDGDGTFLAPTTTQLYTGPGAMPGEGDNIVVAAKLGNGNEDLAFANDPQGTVSVLMGGDNGTFNPPQSYYVGFQAAGLAAVQLSGDGLNDLVVAGKYGQVATLLNTGRESFVDGEEFSVGGNAASLFVSDLNGDGTQDLLLTYDNTNGSYAAVVPGNGDGSFGTPEFYSAGLYPRSAVAADVYGDGKQDLIVSNFQSGNVSVFVNTYNAEKLTFAAQPVNTTAGATLAPIVVDVVNGGGKTITTDNSDVTLSVGNGPGELQGTVTVQARNGVATFSNVSLDTAGAYKLSATDGSDTAAKSNKFSINAAAATQLAFDQQPTNVTAGIAEGRISAALEDQFGNVVSSNNSARVTLGLKVAPTGAVLFETQTVSGGIATFSNLSFDLSGGYKLKATDSGILPGKSSKFFVLPGTPSQLVFVDQPTDENANVDEGPITVEVEDVFGNLEGSDDSTMVTLGFKSEPSGALLFATAAAGNGIATFTGIDFTETGGYKLKATGTNLSPAVSDTFFVT